MLHEFDAMVCLNVPAEFRPVGQFFRNFSQVTDEDVVETLRQSEARISAAGLTLTLREGNVFRLRDRVGILCLGRMKRRVPPCFKIVQSVSRVILGSPLVFFQKKDHTTVQVKTCTVVPLIFDRSLKPLRKAGKSSHNRTGIRVAFSENDPVIHVLSPGDEYWTSRARGTLLLRM